MTAARRLRRKASTRENALSLQGSASRFPQMAHEASVYSPEGEAHRRRSRINATDGATTKQPQLLRQAWRCVEVEPPECSTISDPP